MHFQIVQDVKLRFNLFLVPIFILNNIAMDELLKKFAFYEGRFCFCIPKIFNFILGTLEPIKLLIS